MVSAGRRLGIVHRHLRSRLAVPVAVGALALAAPAIAAAAPAAIAPVVTAAMPADGNPGRVAVTPRTNTAYVSNSHDGTVSVISGRTKTVSATIPVGLQPDGGVRDIWAMNASGSGKRQWTTGTTAASTGHAYADAAGIGAVTTSSSVALYGITTGPDGALWFTDPGNNSIGRITTSGTVTSYTGPGISQPDGITTGPDGALWFTNRGNNSIGRITTSGTVTSYTDPGINGPLMITTGPDGALWFTNNGPLTIGNNGDSAIGRITTAGTVTMYTDPSIVNPAGITAGPDGALWFTDYYPNHTIGRITTSGTVTSYTDPSIRTPIWITAGADGALWFTNGVVGGGNSIGRITTSGTVTSYPVTPQNTLTVTKTGTGAATGTVSSSPAGISCGSTCSAQFTQGSSVTLTATPASGEVFTGWTGPCLGMASSTCTFTVNSNTTVGASFTASATLYQESSAKITYKGTWATSNCLCYSGGHVLYSQTAGNSATVKFTGNLIQFVSERGSTRGSFKVYVNGVLKATVSNYITAPPNQNAVIVWQESFASVATRILKIVVVGTSGHPRVDVDAFVVAN
jgi:virginiamycin B lyase